MKNVTYLSALPLILLLLTTAHTARLLQTQPLCRDVEVQVVIPNCVDSPSCIRTQTVRSCTYSAFVFVGAGSCIADQYCPLTQLCISGTCQTPECTSDANCSSSQKCQNYTCVQFCTRDRDCSRGQTCFTNQCIKSSLIQSICNCTQGYTCTDGICVKNVNCYTQQDCQSVQLCTLQGQCQVITNCGSNADCTESNMFCSNGKCTYQFCNDKTILCPDGYKCNLTRYACVIHTCTMGSDCSLGYACIGGVCSLQSDGNLVGDKYRGERCEIDSHCIKGSQSCNQPTGLCLPQNYECLNKNDCLGSPNTCDPVTYQCTKTTCTTTSQCHSQYYCVGGNCILGSNLGPSCTTKSDCSGNYECVDNFCYNTPCNRDRDCSRGYSCVSGGCVNQLISETGLLPNNNAARCEIDSHCVKGEQTCHQPTGLCVAIYECLSKDDCVGSPNTCDLATRTCTKTTCANGDDCHSGYECVGGVCRAAGATSGTGCTSDAECLTANTYCGSTGRCEVKRCSSDAECGGGVYRCVTYAGNGYCQINV